MVPLVLVTAAGRADVEIDFDASATVADLLAVLGEDGPLTVEGSAVRPDRLLAETLVAGATLATGDSPRPASLLPAAAADPRFRFQVLSGPGAGLAVDLTEGRHLVGSGEQATIRVRAPGVARRHLVLAVEPSGPVRLVSRTASRRLGDETVLLVGDLLACVATAPEPGDLDAVPEGGTVAHNRRPRSVPTPGDRIEVALPRPPPPEVVPGGMSWASVVIPVLVGIAAALLIDPRMAVFALLGPAVMVGGRIEDRARRRRRRTTDAGLARDAAAVGARLALAATDELRRRRAAQPGIATLCWWVARRSPRVWERRGHDPDFLRITVGYGDVGWEPPLSGPAEASGPAVAAVLAAGSRLAQAPVTVDLRRRVLGVAGDRGGALDLVRGLVGSAAVLHGPADLRLAVLTDRPADWEWSKWLPHTRAGAQDHRRLFGVDPAEVMEVVGHLGTGDDTESLRPVVLVVVDLGPLTDTVGSAVRRLLASGSPHLAGVVVAATGDGLPAECTEVVHCGPPGAPLPGTGAPPIRPAAATAPVTLELARGLAGLRDPDVVETGGGLPRTVRLLDLVAMPNPTAESVRTRWSAGGDALDAVVGLAPGGPVRLDLCADGPHVLVAGTTGSGKSELLRTLVASLALAHDPEHLAFVLVDYKGGSAFDAATGLPHTVGLVTDLDGDLAERALRCLEAELRHRERELRSRGAPDLTTFRRLGGRMPRLVVVVDELAHLVRELPGFVPSLIDIAARGRSLGIHLVLATQRPAGVVGDAIRANTDVRISLRVTDRSDSIDVLDDPAAAAIGRHLPGRALMRTGPGGLTAFQAALVTGGADPKPRVTVRPFRFARHPAGPDEPAPPSVAALRRPGDLDALTAAAVEAVAVMGLDPPRRPWPEPLPGRLTTGDLPPPGRGRVVLGLADEPDEQRTTPVTWAPEDGTVVMYGAAGSGLTTALRTVVLGLAAGSRAAPVDVYVIDVGGGLASLADLAPVGAVVTPAEPDRLIRLVRMLTATIERRRAAGADRGPMTVLVVDGLEALLRSLDGPETGIARDGLLRVIGEGPGAGVVSVLATTRPAGVPPLVEGAVAWRLVLRQADPIGAAQLGVRGADRLPTGRAIQAATGRHLQIAVPGPELAAAAIEAVGPRPAPVGSLPDDVVSREVEAQLDVSSRRWILPVGIGDDDLAPVGIGLGPGEHVLVVGGPGSGKSTWLTALAALVARRGRVGKTARVKVFAVGADLEGRLPRGVDHVAGTDLAAAVAALLAGGGPALLVVDDVEEVPEDAGRAVADLAATRRPRVHVVAASGLGIKAAPGHWARRLTGSGTGLWLRPAAGVDADLWRTPLPRRLPRRVPPGRALLVGGGRVELVQLMRL